MEPEPRRDHCFGFVAVTGRSNVGKSTLVNRIIGRKLSIVTSKEQTTRHRITALHNLPQAQIALIDTPGIHDPKNLLNRTIVAAALKTLQDVDVVLFVTVPGAVIHEDDLRIIDLIRASKQKSVLVINKIDTSEKSILLPMIKVYSMAHQFEEIFPVSAIDGSGIEDLVQALVRLLPSGPALFPEDDISDLPVRFFAAEIIREQIMKMTGQEVPYKTTVVVESFTDKGEIVIIHADIHTERESQKKILVGKKGSMIKQIGISARSKLEEFLERRVRLDLFVKVTPRWTQDSRKLKELGYS
ncbi:MAG: GTPase Era [Desulfomonile sp.]